MENIDLALMNVMTSGEISGREGDFHSDTKAEGGFAEVLAGHDEKVEVDSENNRITPPKQKEKPTDKVEPVERDRIATDDSEDADVEIEGENHFQEVPYQEVLFHEASSEEISLGEELFPAVENENQDTVNLDRQSGFSDLLRGSGNLPQQDELLAGISGSDDEVRVSFIADQVVGENPEAEGAAVTDNFILKNSESINDNEILTLVNPVANKTEIGSRAGKDDELIQDRGTSSAASDETGFMSPAKEVAAGLKLVNGTKSAETNESAENFIHAEIEQISSKDIQKPVIAAADFVDLKVEGESNRQRQNGLESLFDNPSPKGNIYPNSSVAAEIPEDVKIHINNEFTAVRAKSENSVVIPGRTLRNPSLSGGETGTVHLQGRARESQSTLAQSEHQLKNFSEFESDAGAGEKLSFSEVSKKIFAEEVTLTSPVKSGVKEKPLSEHNFSKSHEMVVGNLEAGKESLVKNSSGIISAKPLPVSDENLMDQIQTGLSRQVKGRQTVTIKLWPENLGKVDVKLVLRDQQLSATFMVEQSDVKDAMLRKIDSLRDGLSMRGIDVKDIDIKVTSPKSGDGPSVSVGDQRQDNADVWRQYQENGFSRPDSGLTRSEGGENGSEDSILLADDLLADITSTMDREVISGSLHITA